MSDSPGLVGFAIGLVNSVINLPDGQVKFFEEFKLQKYCEINLLIKTFLGLVEMMFGLVNVSFSLPEWQAVKVTFFAPCQTLFGTSAYIFGNVRKSLESRQKSLKVSRMFPQIPVMTTHF